jgi:hypothetical protein
MTTVREFATASAHHDCSTAGLGPLNDQIVGLLLTAVNSDSETNLVSCADIPLLRVVGNSTIPLLQPEARLSLKRVIEEKARELKLVHAYRTIAQQFVLRQWKINGQCGITSARNPGTSDHERAIAIDIDDFEKWKGVLESHQWAWAGPGDRGHFSFQGSGISPKVLTEGVRAFQRLWNTHHPEDLIGEDGTFGDIETGPRLLKSPIEGF